MSVWQRSFLFHIGAWVFLALSALFVKPVAYAPLAIIVFFLLVLPYLVKEALGISRDYSIESVIFFVLAALGLLYFIVAFRRWIDGESGMLLAMAHFVILLLGLFGTALVGQFNFPYRE
jgi:hypothetical protein